MAGTADDTLAVQELETIRRKAGKSIALANDDAVDVL